MSTIRMPGLPDVLCFGEIHWNQVEGGGDIITGLLHSKNEMPDEYMNYDLTLLDDGIKHVIRVTHKSWISDVELWRFFFQKRVRLKEYYLSAVVIDDKNYSDETRRQALVNLIEEMIRRNDKHWSIR